MTSLLLIPENVDVSQSSQRPSQTFNAQQMYIYIKCMVILKFLFCNSCHCKMEIPATVARCRLGCSPWNVTRCLCKSSKRPAWRWRNCTWAAMKSWSFTKPPKASGWNCQRVGLSMFIHVFIVHHGAGLWLLQQKLDGVDALLDVSPGVWSQTYGCVFLGVEWVILIYSNGICDVHSCLGG